MPPSRNLPDNTISFPDSLHYLLLQRDVGDKEIETQPSDLISGEKNMDRAEGGRRKIFSNTAGVLN